MTDRSDNNVQVDAVAWWDAADCRDEPPGLSAALTVGFVVEEDEDSILLAMERHEIDGEVQYRHFTRIPKACRR